MVTREPNEKVDPAALLVAVLAVSIAPITSSGAWGAINTVIALVVGAIVFCFTWPHAPQKFETVDHWVITAQSLVYGLVASVAVAWPVQSLYADSECFLKQQGPCVDKLLADGFDAKGTWYGLAIGILVAALFWWLLWLATKRRIRATGATEPVG